MIFHEINLSNIGPFVGKKQIKFNINDNQNITLIGGNNGTGKTTLLNIIKVTLFGSHSFGLRTITNTYVKEIKSFLNIKALNKKNQKYFSEIKYSKVEDFKDTEFCVKREWKLVKGKLIENLIVKKNGKLLNGEETENYQSKLNKSINISLLNLFMFDGEKIASIAESKEVNNYVREIIFSAFNLDIYENMNNDLLSYIEKEKKNRSLSDEETRLLEYSNNIREFELKIRNETKLINEKIKTQKDNQLNRDNLFSKFTSLGGLDNQKFNEYKDILKTEEITRDDVNKDIRDYLDKNYVFSINKKLLIKAKEQIINELPQKIISLFHYIKSNSEIKFNQDLIDTIFSNEIISEDPLHNVDEKTLIKLTKKLDLIKKENNKNYLNIFLENYNRQLNIFDIRSMMNNSDEKELEELWSKINDLDNKNKIIEDEIEDINEKILTLRNEIFILEEKIIEEESNINKDKVSNSSYLLANSIMKINRDFIKVKILNEIKKVEEKVTKYFNEIVYKNEFIDKIYIDRNNYDFILHTMDNEVLKSSNLSAGENQILLSCLLKSVYDISMISLPIFIDTPLARLSKLNRLNFIKSIIFNNDTQIIIFSTDEEIVGDKYEVLKEKVANKYLMTNETGQTVLETGYFKEV